IVTGADETPTPSLNFVCLSSGLFQLFCFLGVFIGAIQHNFYAARLKCLRDLPLEVNHEQAILHTCTAHFYVVGEVKDSFERALCDTAMEILFLVAPLFDLATNDEAAGVSHKIN